MRHSINTKRAVPAVVIGGAVLMIGTVATASLPSSSEVPEPHLSPTALPPQAAGPPVPEPPLGKVPQVRDGEQVVTPLDPYRTPRSERRYIDQARAIAARDCMHRLGFSEWSEGTLASYLPSDYEKDEELLSYLDPSSAAPHGYPVPNRRPKARPSLDPKAKLSSMPPEALAVYLGSASKTSDGGKIPRGGCSGEAERKIKNPGRIVPVPDEAKGPKGQEPLPASANTMIDLSQAAILRDSRMKPVYEKWRTCLRAKGVTADYQTPLDARDDPQWAKRTRSIPAGGAERRTAAADAQCQQQVNMVGMYTAVVTAYQKQAANQVGKGKLALSKKVWRQWVANAKKIIRKDD